MRLSHFHLSPPGWAVSPPLPAIYCEQVETLWVVLGEDSDRTYAIGDRVELSCVLNTLVRGAPKGLVTSVDVEIRHLVPRSPTNTGVSLAVAADGIQAIVQHTNLTEEFHAVEGIMIEDDHLGVYSPEVPRFAATIVGTGFLTTQDRSMPGGVGRVLALSPNLPGGHRIYAKTILVEGFSSHDSKPSRWQG